MTVNMRERKGQGQELRTMSRRREQHYLQYHSSTPVVKCPYCRLANEFCTAKHEPGFVYGREEKGQYGPFHLIIIIINNHFTTFPPLRLNETMDAINLVSKAR